MLLLEQVMAGCNRCKICCMLYRWSRE